jgi:hypothetical protein
MKLSGCQVSCCSRCRFYGPQGRRGGHCSQLGVPVESRWRPCPLAMPVFDAAPGPRGPRENFLPQPLELGFPDVLLETARLEVALSSPSAPGHEGDAEHRQPAPVPLSR